MTAATPVQRAVADEFARAGVTDAFGLVSEDVVALAATLEDVGIGYRRLASVARHQRPIPILVVNDPGVRR